MEKYDLPVYPVVFYLLPPGAGVTLPGFYHSQFMGLTSHQAFRAVVVWEMEARQVPLAKRRKGLWLWRPLCH